MLTDTTKKETHTPTVHLKLAGFHAPHHVLE